jgi:pilus assembly protein CpaF
MRGGQLVRADGYPPHQERFAIAGYDLQQLLSHDWARPTEAVHYAAAER